MRTVSILAAGALLLSPVGAAAQMSWAELRDTMLDKAAELFDAEDYHAVGFTHEGSLDDGGSEAVTVSLVAGREIALVGVCDADCGDLDMTVYDPGGGEVGSDVATDDVPIVNFTPGRTGRYSMTVRMAGCTVDPCRYAIQVFTR